MSKGTVSPKALFKARVAAWPEFYPEFTKPDGTKVSHRLVARLYVNPVGRKNAQGIRDDLPPMKYTVTAWGEAAVNWAKNASLGKTIDYVLLEEKQYQSKVYVGDQPVIQADGTPLMTTRSSYTILEWFWGDDAGKVIAEDIRRGRRHPGWNGSLDLDLLERTLATGGDGAVRSLIQQGRQAQEAWKMTIQQRNQAQFTPGSTNFGWSVVKQTSSGGQGYQAPAPNTGFQNQVNNAVNNQAPAQPAGGAPGPVYPPPSPPGHPGSYAPVHDPNRGVNVNDFHAAPNAENAATQPSGHNFGGQQPAPAGVSPASSYF